MIDGGEYSTSAAVVANSKCYTSLNTPSKKRRSRIKKRFSDDQIRSLETMFESESKLEPRKKLQVARDLGLQPRQVAIWFQNQRARRKSKQLERDYSILKANYKSLVSQFEALKKEEQSLVIQLQKLRGPMDKSVEESWYCRQGQARNITDGKSHNGNNIKAEFEVKPSLPLDGSEDWIGAFSDDNRSIKTQYLGFEEEPDLLNMVKPADDSLTSPENWGSLDSNGLLDQSSNSYQWWDFWS